MLLIEAKQAMDAPAFITIFIVVAIVPFPTDEGEERSGIIAAGNGKELLFFQTPSVVQSETVAKKISSPQSDWDSHPFLLVASPGRGE